MSKVIIDIETVGTDFNSLDRTRQDYLLKYAADEEEKEEARKKLGLYPLTGEIIAIGMLNPDTMKGCVLYQCKDEKIEKFEEGGMIYETGGEKEILEKFWDRIRTYSQVITFNGRGFDAPYLIMRSTVHRIKPTRNLMCYRYDHKEHCDLLDQLTFYGAVRKYNLDFYAKSFGVRSSKDDGVDGSMVGELYQAGKYVDIARYCCRDLIATKEIFECWDKYIKF